MPVKLSLWNWNVDLLTYTGQFYRLFHNATLFLWESNAFWEILVIMAVAAVISFQFPKMDFFDVLQHTTLCDAVCTFEQLLKFWATFCSASNLEQLLPSLATFEQQISKNWSKLYALFQKPGASMESRHCGQDKRIFCSQCLDSMLAPGFWK